MIKARSSPGTPMGCAGSEGGAAGRRHQPRRRNIVSLSALFTMRVEEGRGAGDAIAG
jgi:hypothetical protein